MTDTLTKKEITINNPIGVIADIGYSAKYIINTIGGKTQHVTSKVNKIDLEGHKAIGGLSITIETQNTIYKFSNVSESDYYTIKSMIER